MENSDGFNDFEGDNEGLHYVHTGGAYDTYLLYPEILQA